MIYGFDENKDKVEVYSKEQIDNDFATKEDVYVKGNYAKVTYSMLIDVSEAERDNFINLPSGFTSRNCILIGVLHECGQDAQNTWAVHGDTIPNDAVHNYGICVREDTNNGRFLATIKRGYVPFHRITLLFMKV